MAEAASRWSNFMSRFVAMLGWIAQFATISNLLALTWIAVAAVICGLIVRDLARDVVTIEPISVPAALAEAGYTPEVASHRLRDAINGYGSVNNSIALSDKANFNSNLDLNIYARDEMPDFVVPTIGLSLNAIVSSIRSVLHYRNGAAISGELVFREKYALRVRVDGRQVFSSGFESDNPDELMMKAAPAIMETIKPSVNAVVLFRDHRQQSLMRADDIIARFEENDVNVQWAYMLKGNDLLDRGEFAQAEGMYRKAISLNWSNPQPHNQLGLALQRQGRFDDAMVQFRRVLGINPRSATAYNNIGVALAEKAGPHGNLDGAVDAYRQAIAVDPRYPLPYNNLGIALARRNEVVAAIAEYHKALLLDPKYVHAHWNLAAALRRQRDLDGALAEYRAALESTKDKRQVATLHVSVGDVLKDKAGAGGDVNPAIAEYREAISIDPTYSWAHNNLGLVFRDEGKLDEAIAEFRAATLADAKNEVAGENLVHAEQAKAAAAPKEASASKE